MLVKGAFPAFIHVHEFRAVAGGTLMIDDFRYTSPFGVLGRIADKRFLARYMTSFLKQRGRYLKEVAETTPT